MSSLSVGSNGSRENNLSGLMLARQTGPMVRDDQKPSQDNIGKACSHGRSLALGAGASELLVLAVHCTEHPLKLKMKFQQDNSDRYELADTVSTEHMCTSSDDRIRRDIEAYWTILPRW